VKRKMAMSGKRGLGGDEALQILLDGNRRFSEHRQCYPNQTAERRENVQNGQQPLAAVLGCADSRVPPELIFDQGIGDLFVLRTAGHVADAATLGSLEYAVAHLGIPLLMVLGHSDCGAVKAAVLGGGEEENHIRHITEAIQPALSEVDETGPNSVDHVAKIHAALTSRRLQSLEPVLSGSVEAGTLKVVACFYSLETGLVEVL
jgi:carbonic anhydrase